MTRPLSRRTFCITAVALALASAAGCGGRYREVVEPPQLTARIAQYAGADDSTVSLRLELTAYNPNPFDLWAETMNATLSIAGQQVGVARVTFEQVLPAQRPLPIVANVAMPRAGLAVMAQNPAMMGGGAPGAMMPAQGMAAPGMTAAASGPAIPFSVNGSIDLYGRHRRERMSVPFTISGSFPASVILGLMPGGSPMAGGVPGTMAPQSSGGGMVGGPSNGGGGMVGGPSNP